MALDPKLLEILACPEDKGPLLYFADEDTLYNPRLKRRYRVLDGDIPDLLIDDAETVDDAEHAAPTKKAEADGVKPTFEALTLTRLAELPRRGRGAARAAGGRARGGRDRARRRVAERRRDPQHRRARHGRLGHLGRRGRGRVQRRAARSGQRAEADPHARVRRARHPGVRDVVLGRHRGDASRWRAARVEQGAQLVAVSCGGELERLARDAGALHVPCPAGFLPRAAIGALVAPLCAVLFRLGSRAGRARDADARAAAARAAARPRAGPRSRAPANPARELARQIGRTIPLIYGGGAIGAVAAYRWKCDVNENAKAPAFWNTYPELDHNEICAWGQHGDVTRQLITLVELRHGFEHDAAAAALRRDAARSSTSACTRC